MKQRLLCWTLAAAFTASVAVADAGQRHGGSSSGSSGSGSSSGSSGSTSGGSSGGSSSSGGGGGSYESSSPPSRGSGGGAVPRHGGGERSGGGRSGGGSSDSGKGGSSAGRGGNYDGGSSGAGAVRRHPGTSGGSQDDNAAGPASVPDYSRPRGGRPIHGYAVPRGNVVPPGRPGGDYNYIYLSPYRWYYDPFAFGTFGLGYIYDPFWWGGYGGYPYGYGGYGAHGYGYGGGGGGGGQDDYQGALRIRVKPREAKVRVDGYFVGTVDDFDGNFQKLRLDDGPHKVELVLDGFNTLAFDVMIVEGQTVTYKGKMQQR